MRWKGHVAYMEVMRNAYKILVGKPEGKIQFLRYKRRWQCNIRMDLREIGWKVVNWMRLSRDWDQWQTVMNTVMKLRVL
jgi:hypothetical protein